MHTSAEVDATDPRALIIQNHIHLRVPNPLIIIEASTKVRFMRPVTIRIRNFLVDDFSVQNCTIRTHCRSARKKSSYFFIYQFICLIIHLFLFFQFEAILAHEGFGIFFSKAQNISGMKNFKIFSLSIHEKCCNFLSIQNVRSIIYCHLHLDVSVKGQKFPIFVGQVRVRNNLPKCHIARHTFLHKEIICIGVRFRNS